MVYAGGSSRRGDCLALAMGATYPATVGVALERQDMAHYNVRGAGGGMAVARGGSRGSKAQRAMEAICMGVAADSGLRRTDGGAASYLHTHTDGRLDRLCGRYHRGEHRTDLSGDIPRLAGAFFLW